MSHLSKHAPRFLLLSLAGATALAGCQRDAAPAADANAGAAAPDAPAYTLDESKLPDVNRFQASDFDANGNACTDFGAYVNGTWLAANPVPGDRTSWGAFEMLDERSQAIQRQLAEQAAAATGATGVDKIVGDLWATGLDAEAINAQGIAPLEPELAAIAALDAPEKIADYLRTSAAKGQFTVFGFGPEADFMDSSMNIGYAVQAGLGLPHKTY